MMGSIDCIVLYCLPLMEWFRNDSKESMLQSNDKNKLEPTRENANKRKKAQFN